MKLKLTPDFYWNHDNKRQKGKKFDRKREIKNLFFFFFLVDHKKKNFISIYLIHLIVTVHCIKSLKNQFNCATSDDIL